MAKKISNWGKFPIVETELSSFSSLKSLEHQLKSKRSMIARGLGRSYGDSSLSNSILSTVKFDKILSFDEHQGILEAQAGISFETILRFIIPKGWFLPVSPGTKYITLGGAVASDVHGKNHHIEGSFSRHILELELKLFNHSHITCSSLNHPDLFWATCGGMGLTGIILSVKFKLKKIETSYIKKVEIRARNLDHIISLFQEYKNYPYSMAWIDCLKGGNAIGRSVMMAGDHAKLEDLDLNQKKNPLFLPENAKLSIPFDFPNIVLNKLSVKAFNQFYYYIHSKNKSEKTIPFDPFFYPLDSILHWNRMYGKRGFVQYQFVLPIHESEKGLVDILRRIRENGMGSFLAVLKLFGSQEELISFPMEGFTLALDFPIQKGLFAFLDVLDEVVLSFGGRIYLTKDARMSAQTFWNSYPRAAEFKRILQKYNPENTFHSFQSDRLLITKEEDPILSSRDA